MRVTAETKLATRRRILEAAWDCFSKAGFDAATTRDIAAAAGIAAGMLFNYFPAKEAIAMALVAEALGAERLQFEGRPRAESLEEDLFALIAAELRALRLHRGYLGPVLETAPSLRGDRLCFLFLSSGGIPVKSCVPTSHADRADRACPRKQKTKFDTAKPPKTKFDTAKPPCEATMTPRSHQFDTAKPPMTPRSHPAAANSWSATARSGSSRRRWPRKSSGVCNASRRRDHRGRPVLSP